MTYEEAINDVYSLIDENGITFEDANPVLTKVIIEALEKQIPKKPIERRLVEMKTSAEVRRQYSCSKCENIVTQHIKRNIYCNFCGQAIDWSDEE